MQYLSIMGTGTISNEHASKPLAFEGRTMQTPRHVVHIRRAAQGQALQLLQAVQAVNGDEQLLLGPAHRQLAAAGAERKAGHLHRTYRWSSIQPG